MAHKVRITERDGLYIVITNGLERPCATRAEAGEVAQKWINDRCRVDHLWRTEFNDKSKPGCCQYENCGSVATDMFAGEPFCTFHADNAKRVDLQLRTQAAESARKKRLERKRNESKRARERTVS